MILMFIKYAVERSEHRLMALVDARAAEELIGRFQFTGTESDPNVASIRRMSEQVDRRGRIAGLAAGRSLAVHDRRNAPAMGRRQHVDRKNHPRFALGGACAKISTSMPGSSTKARSGMPTSSAAVRTTPSATCAKAWKSWPSCWSSRSTATAKCSRSAKKIWPRKTAGTLSEVEAALGEAMVVAADRQEHLIRESENLLKEMQIALVEAAEATVRQQEQLVRQGDVMLQVVGATGQVKQLEEL